MELDLEQQLAVVAPERLVRVVAGAGSGKTRVLTERIVHLCEARAVVAPDICAITFTKKAAEELVRRLPITTTGAQVSTIHSLCYAILRGSRRHRGIADEGLSRRLVRDALKQITEATPFDQRPFLPALSEAVKLIKHAKAWGHPFDTKVRAVAIAYQEQLRAHKLYDFDDLILEPLAMFRNQPESQAQWRGRWKHLLIDEVQDTSAIQWELLSYLVGPETHVFVVGDAQQSIYRFRGADPSLMLTKIDEMFGGQFVDYPLSTNYRSVGRIVQTANKVSFGMPGALTLTEHRVTGEGPVIYGLPALTRPDDSADLIAQLLKAEHEERAVPYTDMAILYRTNAMSAALEGGFARAGVPYLVVGGMGFYGRSEVRDVLAYLAITQGLDDEALRRVYNKPARYLGKVWLSEVEAAGGWPILMSSRMGFSKPYMARRAEELRRVVQELQDMSDAPPRDVIPFIRHGFGYQDWLTGEEPDAVDESVIENLDALQSASERWDTIPQFLAFTLACQRRAAQVKDDDLLELVDRVQLSTVHRAKGLEWPVVVVHGLTRDVFPHKLNDLSEERRILYVAITRARDRLYVSTGGDPSGFYHELFDSFDHTYAAPPGMPCAGGRPPGREPDRDPDDDDPLGGCLPVGGDPGARGQDDRE